MICVIRVIRSFLVYDFVAIMIRGIRVIRSPNLFYISGQEKVRNGVEIQLFCYLCKYFVINQLSKRSLKAAY